MKNIFRKSYIQRIKEAFGKDTLVLLYGARQVGKTTLMHMYREYIAEELSSRYCNCEEFMSEPVTKKWLSDWLLLNLWCDLTKPWLLCLDEIQAIPHIETILKTLYDDPKTQCQIIATWSRFWWQKKVGSSLVWRWVSILVYPFSLEEFLLAKNKILPENVLFSVIESELQEYMLYGWYPAVILSKTHEDKYQALRSIIERIYDKDFVWFMDHRYLIDFKRVFAALCQNITSLLNIDKLASDAWVSRYFIQKFIHFLHDSFLIHTVYPYYTDKTKEYSARPKIYLNDIGLMNFMRWNWNPWFSDGKINENFVLLQLLTYANRQDNDIHYFKIKNAGEIDFLLRTHTWDILPIEVKSNDKKWIWSTILNQAEKHWRSTVYKTSKTLYSSYKQQRTSWETTIVTIPFWHVAL